MSALDPTAATGNAGGVALFAYGFRPFFLLAGLHAALAVPAWLALITGTVGFEPALSPAVWHGHEMLFGYAAAVLAGFLLTAAASWSGTAPVRGAPLAALALLWLAGRAAVWAGGGVPLWLVAALDLAFLPALALALVPALRRAARRNLVFLPLLGVLFAANLLVHLDGLGATPGTALLGERLALDLLALMIGIIGGRIVPAFTANALKPAGVALRPSPAVDRAALGALAALVIADLAAPGPVAGAVALVAAALNAWRMRGWATARTLGRPILWVLHLGYAWLAVGLAWKGVVDLTGLGPATGGLHGIAIGAVGTMTLAVMSRATLGHTGRPLVAGPAVTASYALVSAAAVVRLAAPLVAGGALYLEAFVLSGLLWTAAFALFGAVYAPILARPRADGRPG